jgi:hypothetical protein
VCCKIIYGTKNADGHHALLDGRIGCAQCRKESLLEEDKKEMKARTDEVKINKS